MNKTKIEWTDATWNPLRGCTRVSEGCRNCYAEKVAFRFSKPGLPYEGLAHKVNGHAAWTGKVEFVEEHLLDPLKWKAPRRIFVNSMSDLFHENVQDEWIDKIFAVMALCPQHTFQILTKRPERMLKWFTEHARVYSPGMREMVYGYLQHMPGYSPTDSKWIGVGIRACERWPLPNVWPGVSTEDQKTADVRIPLLLLTPATVRYISVEPLVGELMLNRIRMPEPLFGWHDVNVLTGNIYRHTHQIGFGAPRLDWVIVGGESGSGARPMHPDWVRSLRDQCQAACVPFFFKQWGEWTEVDGGPPNRVFDVDKAHCPIDSVNRVISLDGHLPGCQAEMRENEKYRWVSRVGKKAAGAVLDGREWREFPEVRR